MSAAMSRLGVTAPGTRKEGRRHTHRGLGRRQPSESLRWDAMEGRSHGRASHPDRPRHIAHTFFFLFCSMVPNSSSVQLPIPPDAAAVDAHPRSSRSRSISPQRTRMAECECERSVRIAGLLALSRRGWTHPTRSAHDPLTPLPPAPSGEWFPSGMLLFRLGKYCPDRCVRTARQQIEREGVTGAGCWTQTSCVDEPRTDERTSARRAP